MPGTGEGWYTPDHLPGHAQRLTTRGEDAQPRCRRQQRLGHSSRVVDDVLAVVEHDQCLAVDEHVAQTVEGFR